MKESIYTIPISDAFESRQGCPFCEIRRVQEQRWVEYITGPAMMEPDVRQETNRQGFCAHHYELMLEQQNRLSVALMLQSHLAGLDSELRASKPRGPFAGKSGPAEQSCFICGMAGRETDRIFENIAVVWARDEDFQKMYMQQEYVCLPDCRRMLSIAHRKLRGSKLKELSKITSELALKRLVTIKSDIDAFCKLYDYRSADCGAPSEEVMTAIERAISFLVP